MRDLILTPEAFDDLRAACRWYEEQRSGLGVAFERAVEACLLRVQRAPESCPEIAPPFRRAIVRRYPYDVYYSLDDARVLIVSVVHHARNPAVAKSRLSRR